tara:strand:+ start:432 stop:716 length:285 start_codon:yes stop_codon:yes gene_type:complete
MYSPEQHFELALELGNYYEEMGAPMSDYPHGYNMNVNQTFLSYLKGKYDILRNESIDWEFIDEACEALQEIHTFVLGQEPDEDTPEQLELPLGD